MLYLDNKVTSSCVHSSSGSYGSGSVSLSVSHQTDPKNEPTRALATDNTVEEKMEEEEEEEGKETIWNGSAGGVSSGPFHHLPPIAFRREETSPSPALPAYTGEGPVATAVALQSDETSPTPAFPSPAGDHGPISLQSMETSLSLPASAGGGPVINLESNESSPAPIPYGTSAALAESSERNPSSSHMIVVAVLSPPTPPAPASIAHLRVHQQSQQQGLLAWAPDGRRCQLEALGPLFEEYRTTSPLTATFFLALVLRRVVSIVSLCGM